MVPVQRTKGFSLPGLFSAGLFLGGLAIMLFNFELGALLALLAILIGIFGRGQDTVMVCPGCGHETDPI